MEMLNDFAKCQEIVSGDRFEYLFMHRPEKKVERDMAISG